MNNERKPYRYLSVLDTPDPNPDHKSCWECERIRVAGFPNRYCLKFPNQHIWSGNAECELNDLKIYKEELLTVADKCNYYKLDIFYIKRGKIKTND